MIADCRWPLKCDEKNLVRGVSVVRMIETQPQTANTLPVPDPHAPQVLRNHIILPRLGIGKL